MPCHGNQTLINIMHIKSEPIASDSPRFILKLIILKVKVANRMTKSLDFLSKNWASRGAKTDFYVL